MNRFCWTLWVAGTILILMSWMSIVSSTVGWAGFGVALLGTILSGYTGSRPGPAAPPPRHAASAAMDALARLGDLRDRGTITEDEFEAKKKALLDEIGPGREDRRA